MAEQFPSDTLREIADRARLALGADRALVLPLAGGEPLPPGPEGGPSLSAPIHIDGDPVATLVVSRDPGGAPFGEESALLSTVCELAAHAIAASRRADLRTEQLTLVQAVASAVGAATAVDEAFRMAATVVFEHTRYSGVTATMVDPRARSSRSWSSTWAATSPSTQPIRRDLEAGLVGTCIREQTQLRAGRGNRRSALLVVGRRPLGVAAPDAGHGRGPLRGRARARRHRAEPVRRRRRRADAGRRRPGCDRARRRAHARALDAAPARVAAAGAAARAGLRPLARDRIHRQRRGAPAHRHGHAAPPHRLHRGVDGGGRPPPGHPADVDDHARPRHGHRVGPPARLGHHRAGRAHREAGAARPLAPGRRRRRLGGGRLRVAAGDPGGRRPPLRGGDRPERPARRPVRRLRCAAHADAGRAGRGRAARAPRCARSPTAVPPG